MEPDGPDVVGTNTCKIFGLSQKITHRRGFALMAQWARASGAQSIDATKPQDATSTGRFLAVGRVWQGA